METIPVKTFSSLKPSTFHILTVLSDDAVARYLLNKSIRALKRKDEENGFQRKNMKHVTCSQERGDI